MRRPELVNAIADMMHAKFPSAITYLYGSEARGDARHDSDVDLLVLLPYSSANSAFKEMRYEVLDELFGLELDMFANFSPLVVSCDDWHSRNTPFSINVNREAIRL